MLTVSTCAALGTTCPLRDAGKTGTQALRASIRPIWQRMRRSTVRDDDENACELQLVVVVLVSRALRRQRVIAGRRTFELLREGVGTCWGWSRGQTCVRRVSTRRRPSFDSSCATIRCKLVESSQHEQAEPREDTLRSRPLCGMGRGRLKLLDSMAIPTPFETVELTARREGPLQQALRRA